MIFKFSVQPSENHRFTDSVKYIIYMYSVKQGVGQGDQLLLNLRCGEVIIA